MLQILFYTTFANLLFLFENVSLVFKFMVFSFVNILQTISCLLNYVSGEMRSLRLFFSDGTGCRGQLVIASQESQYKILHFHHTGLDKLAAVFEDWNFLVNYDALIFNRVSELLLLLISPGPSVRADPQPLERIRIVPGTLTGPLRYLCCVGL